MDCKGHQHIQQIVMETSFNALELQGGGGQQRTFLTMASTSRKVATTACTARGVDNASYQQDEECEHQQQEVMLTAGCPTLMLAKSKVCLDFSCV